MVSSSSIRLDHWPTRNIKEGVKYLKNSKDEANMNLLENANKGVGNC